MKHLGDTGVRQRLVRRMASLRADTPRLWGKMSAGEMLCHLNDSFEVAMGRHVSAATGPFQRTILKWGALYVPMPWPKSTPTRPEVEQGAGGTPPTDFHRDRTTLVATMERFCDANGAKTRCPHPVFGPMTEREWLRWGYLHTDHHLRQFGR